ncbi:thiamine phosphate synthase [Aestuariivirga sp.]|uniref:thiamine phosphate synthase n=1 Tax=Aestuariivirga sp. TaxID=2650926 RepID=UPI0039E65E88
MGARLGEGRLIPRLFLVAPDPLPPHFTDCLTAACDAGDVASLLVPQGLSNEQVAFAQSLGVAVLFGDARKAMSAGADGAQVAGEARVIADARKITGKTGIVGAFAGESRHAAMEATEAGADYVALSQAAAPVGGEPLVKWWVEFFEIPCVAWNPVDAIALDTLLPQNPDFIRPADGMWESPALAKQIIAALTERLNKP